MRTARAIVAGAAIATMLAGPGQGATVPVHADGQGPLSVMSGGGGFIADAPVDRPYWVSFAEDVPCLETRPDQSTDPAVRSDRIELADVRVRDRRHPAAKVVVLLRTVTPRMVRRHPHHRDVFELWTASLGHPLRDLPYGRTLPGRYTRRIAGHQVRRTCAGVQRDLERISTNHVPRRPVTTLVFALKTGMHRALIRHALIDYSINGERRRLRTDWQMGARAPQTADAG